MSGERGYGLFLPILFVIFLASSAPRAEEVIMLDDTGSQPTATATFTAVPAQKMVPTPTATPANPQAPTPTPAPAKAQAQAPTPTKTEAAVSTPEPPVADGNLSDSAKLAQRLGVLRHPVIWFAADGNYAYAVTSGDPSLKSGFGLDLRVELQFFSWFSAGTYYNLTVFPAAGRLAWTGPLGLVGRIIPFGADKVNEFNPFLIGGAGLNSLVGQNSPQYPGDFQAFAGVGAVYPFGDKWAADLGLVYNFYSPWPGDLQAISARVGLDYSFEP